MTSTKAIYIVAVFVPFGLVVLGALALIQAYRCRKTLLPQLCAIQA